nr:protodermal factor 1-like [Ipomoea batatas]
MRMERSRKQGSLLLWATMAALLSHNLVLIPAIAAASLNDQKNYYSPPDPNIGTPSTPSGSHGSGGHHGGSSHHHGGSSSHHGGGGSYGGGSPPSNCGSPPHHGGGVTGRVTLDCDYGAVGGFLGELWAVYLGGASVPAGGFGTNLNLLPVKPLDSQHPQTMALGLYRRTALPVWLNFFWML